jgi:DNA-binding response OmpR family regulator
MSISASHTPQSSILVVDDDPDICMALTDLFGEQGYEVSAVGTGTEAVDRVTRHHFDAVLLDVGLPDMDGLAVLSTLTELKPHLPIIILTAYTSFGEKIGILDIPGAYASLAKPYKVQELTATVGRALCYSVPACGDNSQPLGKDLYG